MDINSALSQATQSTPCPWLGPAFGFLTPLINLSAKAGSNKNCMRQLEERCRSLLDIIQSEGETMTPDDQTKLCQGARRTIQGVLDRMTPWCLMPRMELFVKQDKHAKVIERCHRAISNCLNKLQVTSHLEFHRWQSTFKENHRIDTNYVHMIQYLGDLRNKQEIFMNGQLQQTSTIYQISTMMQESLPGHISATAERGLESNLYTLLRSSRTLLPDMNLKRGEVRRISDHPVKGTRWIGVWEGCYLNEEKVAIQVLCAVDATPKTLKRFKLEVEIWRRVFEADKGEHILPIYGFCQSDGEYPYTVSPWMSNGTLKNYVNDHPEVDHRSILKGIVEGIKLLHSMSIVHGDIRAINIAISTDGRPLLSNFGFTRLEEEIMSDWPMGELWFGEPPLRWDPAELGERGGKRTKASDVYAFGMTVLELMTHEKPWALVRFDTYVCLNVCHNGATPPRPTDPVVAERGLDDALWALLKKCWCKDMYSRPTMNKIARCL